jgi:putative DNA primase/helicase
MSERTRRAAAKYISHGMEIIPVPARSKNPRRVGWENERHTLEDVPSLWDNGQNVGVLTGEPSGWMVCVDLDVPEAVEVAGRFLTPTLTSSRHSRPHSHWWYVSPAAETQRFKDVDGKVLLELRSTGCHTPIAPSIHPSGERYVWHGESGLKMV